MEIKLRPYEIQRAIANYLTEEKNLDITDERLDMSEILIKVDNEPKLTSYDKDSLWENGEETILKEYEVEGLFVKRRNKKNGHISYKKAEKVFSDWQMIHSNEWDHGFMEIALDLWDV